ncbi:MULTISPECIES: TAXI family TRAP transporter solute-binding subunit [Streptomyces]|uniref:TAXI family TRAP transporter solute-binding subunit n=1 Tax=Streptomyces TaxID=1883 RepID=UPI0019067C48|nr:MULTISPECIES: TAXI family TRAP transporter solute-binding subunit [unclassified Streptomyces]MCU4748388.1 TAXI family TRAP transporter solute-binding subunit [Streptomyces sp. G-5]QQN78940.1 TAXI family TRAP transporter solute-binding subunit [Streptomyces sp. XC 2026]
MGSGRSPLGLSRRALLTAPLGLAAAACGSSPDLGIGDLKLATGPEGATYRESGAALAALWNEALDREAVEIVFTEASVDNLRLLRGGEVDLAYGNVDVLRPYDGETVALLRIFDSVVHLVTLRDSGIRALADLAGRPVALGLPGSGTRFTGGRLIEAAGVPVEVRDLGQTAAARALVDGEVDAVFSLTAMPTPAISWLLANAPPVHFVDLAAEAETMRYAHPGEYLPVTISGAVYPEVATTATLAVPTLIAVRSGFPTEAARFFTRTAVEGAAALARTRPEAYQINPRTAAATVPITLHPGAAAWFRSVKL